MLDWGKAHCKRYDLMLDFANHRKINTIECVTEDEDEICANCKFCYPMKHFILRLHEWEWHHVCIALAYGDDGFAMELDNPSEGKCEMFKSRKERG